MKNKKLYIVFTILIAIFVAAVVNKELQNDTFFTIPIGNYILENGITSEEQFAYHEGLEFTNSRWLFDVIIASIYNLADFRGIYIFTIIVTISIGLTLFNVLIKRKNNIIISFCTTLTALYFAKSGFTARGQIMSYLIFIIEIYLIEMLLETNKKRYIFGLFGISILLANLHASVWPMYFVFFLPYFAEYLFKKLKFDKNIEKITAEKFEIKSLLITFFISIFAGLCTPIGFASYTDMIKVMSGVSTQFINELATVAIIENLGMFMSLIFYIMLISFNKSKIKVSDFCLITGLYLMGLMAKRNTCFLYLVGSIACARIITNLIAQKEIDEIASKLNNKNLYIFVISILVIIAATSNFTSNLGKEYVCEEKYPVAATEYILENVDIRNMRIFNHFNFGSYLEFKGIPVFIDSRSGVYCSEFNKTTILEDWLDTVLYGQLNYKETFEKYGITHALLYKTELINTYIVDDPDYKVVFEDEYFALYEKVDYKNEL